MKKGMSIFAAVIIVAMVFTSCGGSTASKNVGNNQDSISTITESDPSVTSSEEEGEANENEDWDAVLKSYETYIDNYTALMKKAKTGDASALSDYPAMMQNATDLQTKLGSAENQLSTSQMEKFLELQNKLIKAASEM